MKKRSPWRFALESIEGIVVAAATLVSWPLTGRWLTNWGSTRLERSGPWPGDSLVGRQHETRTRGIEVRAIPGQIWPWLVQFGLGRAGFYSYELLERLVGVPVTNVESIEPRLQRLDVGDEIKLHPTAPGIPVAAVAKDRYVCYGGDGAEAPPDPRRSWSMYVEPTADARCRLIVRSCIEPLREPTAAKRSAMALDGPIDFVMEQRMLRTIKRLAETAA